MVICTGTKNIIHNCRLYTKLKQCHIRLKAALSSNDSAIPEGYAFLHICSADGYHKVLVYYHPSITGTLLVSPTSIINSANEPNGNFTGQSIHRWFDSDTMLTGNITLVLHQNASLASLTIKSVEYCHPWLPLQWSVIHTSSHNSRCTSK